MRSFPMVCTIISQCCKHSPHTFVEQHHCSRGASLTFRSLNPTCRLTDNILWRDVVCRDLGADVSREDVTAQAAIVMSGGHYADWYGTAKECLWAGRTGVTRRIMRTSKYPSRMRFSQSPALPISPYLFVKLIHLQQPVRGVHQTQSAVDLMALRVHDIPRECMCLALA
jgi:hypothetical protein